jgi:hypothetical protein
MVSGKQAFVLIALVASGVSALGANEVKLQERRFGNCFLCEAEGRVWLRKPMVYLGMYGVEEMPSFCLSQDLGKKLAPLVSDIVTESEAWPRGFYYDWMPRLRDGKGWLVLLGLRAKTRPVEGAGSALSDEPALRTLEIVSADVTEVECVRREWVTTWQELVESLNETVSASLSAPSEQKKNRLAAAVEKGSAALKEMAELEVSDEFRSLVGKIAPEAELVGGFQRGAAGQWQEQLVKCAGRLRIQPRTPLPGPKTLDRYTALELLGKSESPARFIAEIKRSYSTGALGQWLLDSESMGRMLQVREIERMSEEEFDKVRAEAKKEFNVQVEQWGVLLRRAPAGLLAEKLILRGALVEKAVSERPEFGLAVGDVIVDFNGTYDFVMGDINFERTVQQLANRVKQGGKLRILRGNEVIELGGKSKE